MDRDLIMQRRAEAEAVFNELETEKQQLNNRLNEIATEQVKLQGEYRAFDKMLEENNVENPSSPSADVIDATVAEEQA